MELFPITSARQLARLRSPTLVRRPWVCATCRSRDVSTRSYSSENRLLGRSKGKPSTKPTAMEPLTPVNLANSAKPYYITTPIFYVNASPHIGHMYSMVLADVLKRWQVLKNKKALLCTGTDEHGMKIQRAAALEDLPPKQFCDTNAATFKDLLQRSEISNDFFIRTTDPDHVEAVKHFWYLLRERDYIYESKHEGWYCVSDETFYPESEIEKKIEPLTGKVHMASIQSGNPVEWIEEKNYHFRMTALKDRLLDFYKEHPEWIAPATRMSEVVQWVKENLEDLSISRPIARLSWGIPVPEDPSQTIYVWLDALINYITKAGFPNWEPGRSYAGGWPADAHVIGKDILRFHCVYWPALLLALDIPLPNRVLCHSHWTLGHKKMSKSVGNVVNPFFALDRFGADAMRFYLIHDGSIGRDSDYGNENIVERYKKSLQFGLGNLTGRVTRPKIWSVREAVQQAQTPGLLHAREDPHFLSHKLLLEKLSGLVSVKMDELNPSVSLRLITDLVMQTNRFITYAAPWDLAKSRDLKDKDRMNESVFLAADSLRVAGILLQPFIPSKASQLLDILGVDKTRRDFAHAKPFADFEYGTPMADPGKGRLDGLFPPLEVED